MEPAVASALHVLGISLGLATLIWRDRAMRAVQQGQGTLDGVFAADNVSGLAALLIIGTGLWRLLGALEKPTGWYLDEYAFHLKLGLFGIGFALETYPMVTFIRWRMVVKRGGAPDLSPLGRIRTLNALEGGCYVGIIFCGAIMARGLWHKPAPSAACAVEDAIVARCRNCHGAVAPQGGLVLQHGVHAALVAVPSAQWPDQTRVVPGEPDRSLLWRKLAGEQAPHGVAMPMGLPPEPALAAQVRAWIEAGAPACRR